MTKKLICLVSFFLCVFFHASAFAGTKPEEPISPLPNFGQVNDSISRSAQPNEEGIRMLAERGVKIVVNFRNEKEWINRERLWVEKNGMTYISMPWSGYDWPDDDRVNEFLKLASDPQNYPLHVHCEKGKERTGVMIACYRERFDHWKFEQAYSEMLRYGFDEGWFGHLRTYVKEFNEFKNREDETISFGWFVEDAKSEFLVMLYSLRKLVS